MLKRFAVIGLGYFGQNLARELTRQGAEVIAIDNTMSKIEEMKDDVAYAVRLDSTDERTLRNQGLEDLDAVIVSIGEEFENALLTCVLLLEYGCKNVIVKSTSPIHSKIFRSVGVHHIVSPDLDMAERLAITLINPDILESISLASDYRIIRMKAPKYMIGKSLRELELRRKYNVNLITIQRRNSGANDAPDSIIGVPMPETVIEQADVLIFMGDKRSTGRLIE